MPDQRSCDICGVPGAVLAPHTGKVLCDPCFYLLFFAAPSDPSPSLDQAVEEKEKGQ